MKEITEEEGRAIDDMLADLLAADIKAHRKPDCCPECGRKKQKE